MASKGSGNAGNGAWLYVFLSPGLILYKYAYEQYKYVKQELSERRQCFILDHRAVSLEDAQELIKK